MLMATLKDLEPHNPCGDIWASLLDSKPGIDPNTPFPISDCLPHITLGKVLWLMDQIDDVAVRRVKIAFVCDCAERVLKFFETLYPGDMRPRRAVEAARLFSDSTDVVHAAAYAAYAASVAASCGPDSCGSQAAASAAAAAYAAASAVSSLAACNNYYIVGAVLHAANAAAADGSGGGTDTATAEQVWQIAHFKSLLDGVAS